MSRRAILTSAALLGFSGGCERAQSLDRQEVLRQSVAMVILPTFVEITEHTDALASSSKAFDDAPSSSALSGVRDAWRAGRGAWNRAAAFLIGPSDDLAITGGAIDAWPGAADKIEALVAGKDPIDETRASTLGANQRGFPGIEQLLFDSSLAQDAVDARLLDDPSAPRRRALVAALAADLTRRTKAVRAAWEGPQGYGHQIAEAGVDSKELTYQREGVDKLVTAMLACAETTLVAKLGKPLGLDTGGPVRPDLEEASRSDTSLAWIEQNLLGLDALYECRSGDRTGLSFAKAVAEQNAHAHRTFRAALDDALAKVRAATTPMRVMLAGDRAPLVAIHGAVQAVKRSINTDVASALGASIGFGFSDTD